jgi:hypothetical protein
MFFTKRVRTVYSNWAFSSSFWQSGIGVLVPAPSRPNGFVAVMSDAEMWTMIVALIVTLFLSGIVYWLIERVPADRENDDDSPETVGHGFLKGVAMGTWWSATTVTTVGYGDTFPKTWSGKMWAMFIMFSSLFLIAAFTGAVTSAMTVSAVNAGANGINGVNDLDGKKVGVLAGSFPDHYMTDSRPKVHLKRVKRMRDATAALLAGKIDAIVAATDVLQYQSSQNPGKTIMVGFPFHQHALVWPFTDTSENNKALGGYKALAGTFTEGLLRLEDETDGDAVINKYFGSN